MQLPSWDETSIGTGERVPAGFKEIGTSYMKPNAASDSFLPVFVAFRQHNAQIEKKPRKENDSSSRY